MKYNLLLLILIVSFSCVSNKTYYEKPIKNWLDKNLNDISSYKSVEFIVLDSANFIVPSPKIEGEFSNLTTTFRRKMDVISSVASSITDSTSKANLNHNRKILANVLNGNISILPILFEANNNINNDLLSINISSIDDAAMLEAIDHRIEKEKEEMESELIKVGISIKSFSNELKNGQFIYHKFRAKNSLGAVVLSAFIFKMDNSKTDIEKIFKIE